MDRRAFLVLGLGSAMAGCLGVAGQPTTRIQWIRLVNDRSEAYETEVVVEASDETVFRDQYRIGTGSSASTVDIEDPVDGRASYIVRFLADGQWIHVYPEEYADVDGNCIGVRFTLDPDGTRGLDLESIDECS